MELSSYSLLNHPLWQFEKVVISMIGLRLSSFKEEPSILPEEPVEPAEPVPGETPDGRTRCVPRAFKLGIADN